MTNDELDEAVHDLAGPLRSFLARRTPSADVDDVLQDVFFRMHRCANRDRERLHAWAYRIATSAVADFYRSRRTAVPLPHEELDCPATSADEPENTAESQLSHCVAPFVAALPEPYREALTLTELQGYSQRDAARKLGVSLPGMKSRVQRGRVKLRELFDDCCAIETDARGRVLDYAPRPRPSQGCSSRSAPAR